MRRTTDRITDRQRGFTLVEAIVVIVITGIIAGIVAVFVRMPVQGQLDTQARADMADAADLALRRMTRELRLALPRTVIVYNNPVAIQFLLTKTGGRYIDVNDQPPASLLPLRFDGSNNQFDMVGTPPTGRQAIVAGEFIVLGNTGAAPSNAYAFSTDAGNDNVSQVAAVNGKRITLVANRFRTTPGDNQGFRVVTGTVTYVCTPGPNGTGTLRRHFTAGIAQGVGNLGSGALLSNMIAGCIFNVTALPGANSGSLMTLALFLQHANGERAQLIRQTQLDNP